MLTKRKSFIAAAVVLATPTLALAHPGHGGGSGLGEGLLHPLSGLDHVLVIAAVGLLSVRMGGRAMWAIPAAFIACCVAGGATAWATTSASVMPMVEITIVASVLVCGVMLIRRDTASLFALALVPMFGLFHGYAHIHELGEAMSLSSYSLGLFVATVAMLAGTITLGVLIRSLRSKETFVGVTRAMGCSLVVAAAAMWLS